MTSLRVHTYSQQLCVAEGMLVALCKNSPVCSSTAGYTPRSLPVQLHFVNSPGNCDSKFFFGKRKKMFKFENSSKATVHLAPRSSPCRLVCASQVCVLL